MKSLRSGWTVIYLWAIFLLVGIIFRAEPGTKG